MSINYGLDKIIETSSYPATKEINKMSSILSFVGLKLSNVKRYSDDDLWCRDLPQIIEIMNKFDTLSYPWLQNKNSNLFLSLLS
jgi:hypothetical protein